MKSSSAASSALALWDEVKDKLKQSGMALSGGQHSGCALRAPSPSSQR